MEQYIDTNIDIKSTREQPFAADKKLAKAFARNEKIRSRVWELDFLRGICVILMVWDHLMFDIMDIFGDMWYDITGNVAFENMASLAMQYWDSTIRAVVRPMVLFTFFTLCGISCSFSRNNLKRGLVIVALAIGVSVVTIPLGLPIYFGVLHMLGLSVLLVAFIKLITKKSRLASIIVPIALALVMFIIEGIFKANNYYEYRPYLFWLSESFAMGGLQGYDYFPILEHTPFVLIGAGLAPLLYPHRRTLLARLDTNFRWYRPINFLGRHAAIIYVTHQVGWFVVLALITMMMPGGFAALLDFAKIQLGIG